MRKNEILSSIAAARNAGSFTLRIVFTAESEIRSIRSFVGMLDGGGIAVDDETMMKLRLVALLMKWPEDTDRVVVMNLCDNFDEQEFVAKFEHAIEDIRAVPRPCLCREHEGMMDPKKAIRHAQIKGLRALRIVIPKATDADITLFMNLIERGFVSFTDSREQLVFEEAIRGHGWSIGGRLSARVLIDRDLPEHAGSAVMHGAHVRVKTVKVI